MYDVIQVVGSLLILAAFVAAQLGKVDQTSYSYLIGNAVGSAILTGTAIISQEWGFILLEGVWALVSLFSLTRKLRGRRPVSPHGDEGGPLS